MALSIDFLQLFKISNQNFGLNCVNHHLTLECLGLFIVRPMLIVSNVSSIVSFLC